jgi:glycosyltransferase involved in cell wall biosynthesis
VSLKLLFVIHHPVFGGPHNEALRLHPVFSDLGVDLTVMLPKEAVEASERLRSAGLEVLTAPLHRVRARVDPALHLALMRTFRHEVAGIGGLIRTRGIELVMIGGGLLNPHGALAARRAGIPVIWKVLDMSAPAVVRVSATQVMGRLSNAMMFNGAALIDAHRARRIPRLRVVAYYPPVDTKLFRSSIEVRSATRRELGIPEEAPVIGTVANLNPLKGVEYFIRAASLIYSHRPDAWFVIVGSRHETHQAYSDKLENEARESGVPARRMRFIGHRADIHRYYPSMDVKLITSRTEGTTTTAMEAMASEVPVVAARVGAIPEVVEDGATGLIVRPEDPPAFSQAALHLLDRPELRKRMGTAARRRAVALYDVQVCAEQHVRLFEQVRASHRSTHDRTSLATICGSSLPPLS